MVLVGLPGSGKTTIGRLAAGLLSAPFADVDEVIERETGLTVRALFAAHGEAGFRKLELEAASRLLAGPPALIAPGGGWAASPRAMERAQEAAAFIIYLSVPPEIAAARCGPAGSRPLLSGGSPRERLAVLLEERAPFYQRSDVVVSNAADAPDVVATLIAELARRHAGW